MTLSGPQKAAAEETGLFPSFPERFGPLPDCRGGNVCGPTLDLRSGTCTNNSPLR